MLNELMKKIKHENIKKVGIQAPSGLKFLIPKITNKLDEKNIDYIISSSSCYGGCDLDLNMDVDLLVHLGHNEIVKSPIPVFYYDYQHEVVSIDKDIFLNLPNKIGVLFNINHKNNAERVIEILKTLKKDVILGKKSRRGKYVGQILGCNFDAAKNNENDVDCFLFVGDGTFHSLGLSLFTKKPVYQFDPFSKTLTDLVALKQKFLKKRYAQINKAKSANVFGVVMSTKIGQKRIEEFSETIELLKKHNRQFVKISANEIVIEQLDEFRFCDAFIIVACPRIAIDNQERIKKPLLTVTEAEMLFLDQKYVFDEIN